MYLIVAVIALILAFASFAYAAYYITDINNQLASLSEDLGTLIDVTAPEGLALLREAKAEGKLVVYGSLAAPLMKELGDRFHAAYPFIEVESTFTGGTYASYEKVQAEIAAGNLRADIVLLSDPLLYVEMKGNDQLMFHNSTQYQFFPEWAQDTGWWLGWTALSLPVIYNTDLAPRPTSYWDLTNPAYKGKIAMEDVRTSATGVGQYFALREELGTDFWEAMGQQDVYIDTGWTVSCEKCAVGEIYYLLNIGDYMLTRYRDQQGAHMDGVFNMTEGTYVTYRGTGILKDAPHPTCAKLFFDWSTSRETQTFLAEDGWVATLRTDVPPMAGVPPLGELDAMSIDLEELEANRDDLRAEFASYFGLPPP